MLLKCLMGALPVTRGTCWSTRPKYWDGPRIDDRLLGLLSAAGTRDCSDSAPNTYGLAK
jgi:hypothetical protein